MTLRKQLAVLLLASAMAGVSCAAQESKSDDAATSTEAIAAAEAARQKAASVGGEWRDTGKLIKKAKAAAKEGDHAKAAELASQARKQGELGYEQAMDQKNAGIPGYMK